VVVVEELGVGLSLSVGGGSGLGSGEEADLTNRIWIILAGAHEAVSLRNRLVKYGMDCEALLYGIKRK